MIDLSRNNYTTIKADVEAVGTIKTKQLATTDSGLIIDEDFSKVINMDIPSKNYKSSLFSIPMGKKLISLTYNEAAGKFNVATSDILQK